MKSDSLQWIEVYSTDKKWSQYLPADFKLHSLKNLKDYSNTLFSESYSLLLLDQATPFSEIKDFFQSLRPQQLKKLKVIYAKDKFSSEDLISISEMDSIKYLIEVGNPAISPQHIIHAALTSFSGIQETDNLMEKVRSQNKTLNELNDNLEKIVEQRTEHIEISKKELEFKLKESRELIKFIKSLSHVDGFEDLLLILRQEFIRYHKLDAPVMIYSLNPNSYRCIYFQGPQLVDQVMKVDAIKEDWQTAGSLRESLANTLGRPMNPIFTLSLQSQEQLGLLIFEHNMDSLEQKHFLKLLEVRIESLRVAFERLVLKWKAHQISKQWSTTFDALEDPIVIIDQNYKVIRSNKKFFRPGKELCYKMFAQREEVCVGCPVTEAVRSQVAQTGKISKADTIYEVHAYPIQLAPTEKSFHMIVHYTNVTQSMKLQGQIIQSEKMAALGLLAGNIAHELNNPLTGIKSLAQILISESAQDSALQKDLQEIEAAAQRSESIIKNLLEFSSLHDSPKMKVSLREIIFKTLPFLKTTMRYHNCVLELSEESDFVEVEPQLLQQVIFNLVNNACQAMGETGTLSLRTQIKDQVVELSVEDTGPGIPTAIREAIFTPFFTTKAEGQGTGLGLSMSRAIVEKFSGSLRLNGEKKQGTEFIIHLPRSVK